MLVGSDPNQIIERRLRGAGCHVVRMNDSITAIDQARHEYFDVTVLVSSGPLINVAETIFNLRDINRSMEIIIVVDRMGKESTRFLRPLLQHPIERTRILTRRQLQKHLQASTTPSPPGKAV
jgi:hypothetical protein